MTDAFPIDAPAAPRDAERLDTARLEPWLREHLAGFEGALQVEQFRKGHSNLTYRVSDGTREWVLRRGPFGSHVATAHDMGREYRILSRLHPVYPPAPRAWVLCEDEAILGAPFYVMERVRGVILRDRPPAGVTWTEDLGDAVSRALVENLARIHAVDLDAADLRSIGRGEGYVRRQVDGWTRRYEAAQTDAIEAMDHVARWLDAHLPPEVGATLIHNDYKLDNVVLDPDQLSRVVGVLDWEMATVGDPLMDLGTTLAYWITADDPDDVRALPFGMAAFPGSWSRERVAREYGALTGRDVSGVAYYHVFGLFKVAVVAQQIYARFAAGKTDDPRFAMMIHGVRLLSSFARRIADASAR